MKLGMSIEKVKIFIGVAVALCLAAFAGVLANDAIDSLAADDLGTATQCTFIIPPFFIPGEEPGLFVNESYPMESSSIKYSFYDNGKDKVLTNREKLELQNAPYRIEDMSASITQDIYEETMSEVYNQDYGTDVGFSVSSFDKKSFDGFPGYRIISDFKVGEEPQIHQEVYIILSKYRTFTITYQRADDDDCEALFEESAATIHVR